ncbi:molybdopterin-binding protein [Methanomicrobium sp. W14]|uniref:TOBE domain-containing protein n=1 Tax=Methanomicrobium sp. W14 TaxID=2817839 RepID=UPI001AE8A581|nr:TOBE domain-containing protein [Methanomicrobium sp. W14]MBP2132690.1 molybdopterin-binding protein [Methanomicrobium sp. W14]
MKYSARNVLKGTVKEVHIGEVAAEVIISLPGGSEIVSMITKESVEKLGLKPGKEACAIIKASNVIIGTD